MIWITAPDPIEETWRRLLRFANRDVALDLLARGHGRPATRSERSNHGKVANQIRVALLQAREYFQTAAASSVVTSPTPLYYGAVGLTTAIMVARGGLGFTLDNIRRRAVDLHHGLKFSTEIVGGDSARTRLEIIEKSRVSVLGSGHFARWTSTLPKAEEVAALVRKHRDDRTQSSSMSEVGQGRRNHPDDIVGQRWTLLQLSQRLPDLFRELADLGVLIPATRVDYEIDEYTDGTKVFSFALHGTQSQAALLTLCDRFRWPATNSSGVEVLKMPEEGQREGFVRIRPAPHASFQFPDIRMTNDGEQIAFGEELNTFEIVDAFLLSYGYGMLARYYPDLWMACHDSHCLASKLIEASTLALLRKLPALTLAQFYGQPVVASVHKVTW